jgi:hypothetical protein
VTRPLRGLIGGLVACVLAGCATDRPYRLRPDEPAAYLKAFDVARADMCEDGTFYDVLPPPGQDRVPVPANKRVTFGSMFIVLGYNVIHSCYPTLSFIPETNKTYVLHAYVEKDVCHIEVVREDAAAPVGVTFEDAVGAPVCRPK